MGEFVEINSLKKLVRIYNETDELREFIKKIVINYESQIDRLIDNRYKDIKEDMFAENNSNNNRPLFTEETTRKILKSIEEKKKLVTNSENI